MVLWALGAGLPQVAAATALRHASDLTARASYWVDTAGNATLEQATAASHQSRYLPHVPGQGHTLGDEAILARIDTYVATLGDAALWLRLDLPALEGPQRWYLQVDFSALDLAVLYLRNADGAWITQQAGDRIPLSRWSIEDRSPVFEVGAAGPPQTVWLRLVNRPVPLNPRILLMNEAELQHQRAVSHLLLGGYLGLGLLVLFLGLMSARLYRDRAFGAYAAYVGSMLAVQVAYTGLGGLFLWPESPGWGNVAPAVFTSLTSTTSVWFVREVAAVRPYSVRLDRFMGVWGWFGVVYPALYATLLNQPALWVLTGYMVLSIALSLGVCLWTWRMGEKYALWVLAGFAPVLLTLPFPALRNMGVLPAGFLTQFSLLVGGAIEIPLLMYILHRRARELSDNTVRMQALDHVDPLTGLVAAHVLRFRLRDALLRARRNRFRAGLLAVGLVNHGDIAAELGDEAADRALVLVASQLVHVVRDVDTVARTGSTRFAVLVEGPIDQAYLVSMATHLVARGLVAGEQMPNRAPLKLRVVTSLVPEAGADRPLDGGSCLENLAQELVRLAEDPRRTIRHLSD